MGSCSSHIQKEIIHSYTKISDNEIEETETLKNKVIAFFKEQDLNHANNETLDELLNEYKAGSEEELLSYLQKKYIFRAHMTMSYALKLSVGEKIDHRLEPFGHFIPAIITHKKDTNLQIKYDRDCGHNIQWSDFRYELYRFAKFESISKRPSHRLQHLKTGDYVKLNPSNQVSHSGWKLGKITAFDIIENGQIAVEYKYNTQVYTYWSHLDNTQEIKEFNIHKLVIYAHIRLHLLQNTQLFIHPFIINTMYKYINTFCDDDMYESAAIMEPCIALYSVHETSITLSITNRSNNVFDCRVWYILDEYNMKNGWKWKIFNIQHCNRLVIINLDDLEPGRYYAVSIQFLNENNIYGVSSEILQFKTKNSMKQMSNLLICGYIRKYLILITKQIYKCMILFCNHNVYESILMKVPHIYVDSIRAHSVILKVNMYGNAVGYRICYGIEQSNIETLPHEHYTTSLNELTGNTNYTVCVQSYTKNGVYSSASNIIHFKTPYSVKQKIHLLICAFIRLFEARNDLYMIVSKPIYKYIESYCGNDPALWSAFLPIPKCDVVCDVIWMTITIDKNIDDEYSHYEKPQIKDYKILYKEYWGRDHEWKCVITNSAWNRIKRLTKETKYKVLISSRNEYGILSYPQEFDVTTLPTLW